MYMLNAQMNKRIDWIDISKGIGVILLVIGHMPSIPYVIQKSYGGWKERRAKDQYRTGI